MENRGETATGDVRNMFGKCIKPVAAYKRVSLSRAAYIVETNVGKDYQYRFKLNCSVDGD